MPSSPSLHDSNFATMETDLSLGPAPAVADAASATIMRRAGDLLRVLAKHLFDGSDPGRQTEALKGAVRILPSHGRSKLAADALRFRHLVAD